MSKDGRAPLMKTWHRAPEGLGRGGSHGFSTGGDDGFEFVVWNPFPHRCTFYLLGVSLWLTHSFKQYLLSTNYGPDFVGIKQIRHKIPSSFQAQSHGDDFSNWTCIEHLLYTRHCSRCFAGVYNLFLPTTQKGAFNIPILPTRKSRHGEDYSLVNTLTKIYWLLTMY